MSLQDAPGSDTFVFRWYRAEGRGDAAGVCVFSTCVCGHVFVYVFVCVRVCVSVCMRLCVCVMLPGHTGGSSTPLYTSTPHNTMYAGSARKEQQS